MKLALREFKFDDKDIVACFVYCPACERSHRFIVVNEADQNHVWQFSGTEDLPTFTPSILVDSGPMRPGDPNHICHSYLTAGVWEFLNDSTHAMADQKIPMVDFPENYRV